MKKMLLGVLVTVLLLVGTGGTASATPIKFTDITTFSDSGTNAAADLVGYRGSSVKQLEFLSDYVTWKHQFTFMPAAQQNSISGRLSIFIEDDERDRNGFRYLSTKEYALGYTESGNWAFGEVNAGTYSYNINASSSLQDGVFQISLIDVGGDFSIVRSELEITYEPVNAPVPEPGTMVLLGFGMLGLAIYGKRRMYKQ